MNNFDVLLGMKLGGGGGSSTLVPKTITANGTYNPADDNADGYSSVTANVPNSYTVADEGKVVDSGALVSQTAKNIDANGLYDTTLNNSVSVDVPNTYSASDNGKVVSNQQLVSQTAKPDTITVNDTYNTTEYNSVTVNVPNSYTAGDEGKVVSSGALVSQTAYPSTVVSNGTIDTTFYNSVDVAVGETIRNDVEYKDVNFYDYEGTRVYSYTQQEFLALTEMPSGLTYDDLTFVGWNWSLSDAQTYVTNYHYLNVGAYVTPKNHDFLMRVSIPTDGETVMINLRATNASTTITINWGDNSTADTFTSTSSLEIWTPQHSYINKGNYEITIDTTDICCIGKLLYHPNDVIYSTAGSYVNEIYPSDKVYCYDYIYLFASNYLRVFLDTNNLKIIGVYSQNMFLPNTINTALYYITAPSGITLPSSLHRVSLRSGCTISTALPYLEDLILNGAVSTTQNFQAHAVSMRRLVWTENYQANNVGSLFSGANNCDIITAIYNQNPYTGYVNSASIQSCVTLQHITFTKNVSQIGTQYIGALTNCISLKSVTFESTTPPTIGNASTWQNVPTTCIIYVPTGTLTAYTTAANYPDPNTYTYIEY